MAERNLWQEAEQKVSENSSDIYHDPMDAGVKGFAIVAIGIIVFAALAGMDIEKFGGSFFLTSVAGFAVPYFYFRAGQNKRSKKIYEEYQRLKEKNSTDRT
jgi:hypothetical protein